MNRYIDADKIEYFTTIVGSCEFAGYKNIAFKEDIDEIPTADVVEVRHGRWETIPNYSNALTTFRHICSECNTFYRDILPLGHDYCHNCGAKMDAESEGEG